MSSAFDELWADSGETAMRAVFGDTVSIRRGTSLTTGIIAQKFLGERTLETSDGGTVKFYGAAWVVLKADYAFGGTVSDPRSGDRVVEASGSEWEVTPIEGIAEASEQPGGREWLLMTKRVKA
jgi:hypothetical protein